MIDAGSTANDAYNFACSLGINKLDALVITSFRTDSIAGASKLVSSLDIEKVILPTSDDSCKTVAIKKIEKTVTNSQSQTVYQNQNTSFSFGTATVSIFISQNVKYADDADWSSLAVKVECNNSSVLIMGSMTAENSAALITSGAISHSDIIIASNHGNYGYTTAEFVTALGADTVIMTYSSASFIEDSKQLENELLAINVTVIRTSADKGASFTSVENGFVALP